MQSLSAAVTRAAADPTRPIYHFCPPALWMNDPNAPLYHNGWFHLFYQHNPYSDDWGHMHWGHARSRDLVHWEHLPIALWPSLDQGEEHVFSGCAWRNDAGEPLLFYTSVKTGGRESRPPNQQWAARPLDADLIAWEKHPANPILTLENHGGPPCGGEWRDPFIFAEAGRTFLALGSDFAETAAVALYETTDETLTRWRYRGLLHQAPRHNVRFFECPNFAKIGEQWMLLTSPYRPVEYVTGDFDLDSLTFTPRREGVLDPGSSDTPNFYASNLLFDKDGRCILFGWGRGFPKERGWNGCLALPRILTIDAEGQPRQQPIAQLQQLRGPCTDFGTQWVSGYGQLGQTFASSSLEIEVTLRTLAAGEIGIKINGQTLIHYMSDGRLTLAGTEVTLAPAPDGITQLHIFVDRSIVELFANDGRLAMTRIVEIAPGLCRLLFYNKGGAYQVDRLRVWEMNPARLSTWPGSTPT
jgi:beta-fructofuranosidase